MLFTPTPLARHLFCFESSASMSDFLLCRLEALPADMQAAFQAGTLLPSALERYLNLEANWFLKIFMPLQGVALPRYLDMSMLACSC
jgi:hypothetical protein